MFINFDKVYFYIKYKTTRGKKRMYGLYQTKNLEHQNNNNIKQAKVEIGIS